MIKGLLVISFTFVTLALQGQNIKATKENWLKFHDLHEYKFSIIDPAVERKLMSQKIDVGADYLKQFESFFMYSPDSSHYIDMDSYNLILEKDSVGTVICKGKALDAEVKLVSLVDSMGTRLLFYGSAGYYETAFWLNDSVIEVFGWENYLEEGALVPVIHHIDVKNALFSSKRYGVVFTNWSPKSYDRIVRLKSVKFVND